MAWHRVRPSAIPLIPLQPLRSPHPIPEPQIACRTTPFGAPVARPSGVQEPWLTPADIAARLKVSRATVYALLKNGALPHRRVGLSLRIAPSDLDAFLQQR